LFLDVCSDVCLLLEEFLEGEDGDGVLDDSSGYLDEGGVEVVDSEVVEVGVADVVVDAGVHCDRDVV
jgi:hypothetical protein